MDGSQLEEQLALLVGDQEMAELEIRVRVEPNHGTLAAAVVVEQRGEQLWSRILELQPADCPEAAEAAAISIHQGLAALPGWGTAIGRLPRLRGAVDLVATAGDQLDGRFSLGGGVGVRLFGRIWAWSRIRFDTSLPIPIDAGEATLIGGGGTVGLAGVVRLRSHGVEVATGFSGGWLVAMGRGFADDKISWVSRTFIVGSVSWLPPGPFRIGLETEVPAPPFHLTDLGGGTRWQEPNLRLGLSVGLRFR